jgi:hypothetical protein
MDGEKFDNLIKRFCTTRLTRKSALRGLVAGAAAALTGVSFASDNVAARKRRARIASDPVRCACSDDLSPKQCPAKSGNEFTCKLCPGIKKGSVQVKCGDPNICVCQSEKCVVGDKVFKKGDPVDVCEPKPCPTDVTCDDNVACTVDTCGADGFCTHTPDDSKCDDNVACTVDKCDPIEGCTHTPDDSLCTPSRPGCTVKCDPIEGCIETCICVHSTLPDQNCKDACTASGQGCGQECEAICGPACPVGTEDRQCIDSDFCNPACFENCKFIC